MNRPTHVISENTERELFYCSENMSVQRIPVWDLTRRAVNLNQNSECGTDGIYVFYREKPPHLIYLGRSEDLERRVVEQRRLRSNYSYVLIFRLKGYIDFETLTKLETCALRMASARWTWAKWENEKDVLVGGHESCKRSVNPALLHFLEKILEKSEFFIRGSQNFDPSPAQRLSPTHQMGSPFENLYAIGAAHTRGMTVLKGSRLPSSVKSRSHLRPVGPKAEALAVKLYRDGILHRRKRTNSRPEGLYFMQDYWFRSKEAAASFISLTDRPASEWKLSYQH